MDRCLDCGTEHEDRKHLEPPSNAEELIDAGAYECPTPPVMHARWGVEAWAAWITWHGEWRPL